jgi:hypothetical protein
MYAVLLQTGAKLTGSAGPTETKQFPITTGTVEGKHLIFEVHMGGGTIRFDVNEAEADLRGTMTLSEDDGHVASANVILKRVS